MQYFAIFLCGDFGEILQGSSEKEVDTFTLNYNIPTINSPTLKVPGAGLRAAGKNTGVLYT